MSIHDEIGDLQGGQGHLWRSERRQAIIDNFKFDETRSNLTLDRDLEGLPQEVIAAEIARNIYGEQRLEFNTRTFHIATLLSRKVAEKVFKKSEAKELVFYFGGAETLIPAVVPLAWLSQAFDAGATPADLLAWGVEPFTVIQLIWWQAKPGETRLERQIRALRNGWGLPWLAAAVRDNYGNLARAVDRNTSAPDWLEAFANDIVEVRELLDFFRDQSRADEKPNEPIQELSDAEKKAWAKAFADAGVLKIAPDARGRWAMLPKQSLEGGDLREPVNTIARYFKQAGFKPKDWGKNIDETWFVRVGDQ